MPVVCIPPGARLRAAGLAEFQEHQCDLRLSELTIFSELSCLTGACLMPGALTHQNAFELLVATILSAQCTDNKVNVVTLELLRNTRQLRCLQP